jgi:ubiquinone biosynthesis protein
MRLLSPEINTMELIKPYSRKLMLQKANPGYLFRKMFSSAVGFERNIMKLPSILNSLLSRAAEGDFSVGVKVVGLEESVTKLERISNRLILAILVGCLLVASSLVVLANTPPFLWGMPMLGVIGYLVSTVLAIYIIIKTFRT